MDWSEGFVSPGSSLSPMGWLGIYSVCFSQLDGDKDSLVWDFLSLSLSD